MQVVLFVNFSGDDVDWDAYVFFCWQFVVEIEGFFMSMAATRCVGSEMVLLRRILTVVRSAVLVAMSPM